MAEDQDGRPHRGRRIALTVFGTLLWIAVGNAVLHIQPVATVYGIAVIVAIVLWLLFSR